VLTPLAKGRFKVKVEPEILPLKIVPEVPVARVVTPVSVEAMVILPGVVVVIVTLEPATRLATPQLPEPWAVKSCPVTVGEEEVAVPPLAIGITPVMPMVEVPVMAMLEPAVKSVPISE